MSDLFKYKVSPQAPERRLNCNYHRTPLFSGLMTGAVTCPWVRIHHYCLLLEHIIVSVLRGIPSASMDHSYSIIDRRVVLSLACLELVIHFRILATADARRNQMQMVGRVPKIYRY